MSCNVQNLKTQNCHGSQCSNDFLILWHTQCWHVLPVSAPSTTTPYMRNPTPGKDQALLEIWTCQHPPNIQPTCGFWGDPAPFQEQKAHGELGQIRCDRVNKGSTHLKNLSFKGNHKYTDLICLCIYGFGDLLWEKINKIAPQ